MEIIGKEYDPNFCFPVRDIENERLKLTPFMPALHAKPFYEGSKLHPELYNHIPAGPYDSAEELASDLFESRLQPGIGELLFAVFDKTQIAEDPTSSPDGTLAGIVALINSSAEHLCAEIGFVIILPAFHRTHVTTNTVGLLQCYCLDLSPDGLGLRRCQWQASASNEPSLKVAKRMGFKWEGIKRWDRVMPVGRIGNGLMPREGDVKGNQRGRDTAILAICWDDWITERENVIIQMARK
ncbi:hypothetical protein JAAARDRAFT_61854 [Jaapia argillacea MUCL 33604]|uniref:N-acetyltransferase domain-containing protein n=1 Tax=Jaapia argillacea MUCL 33604 TaxID=933084 RepID=A0A067PCS1_9AGAM|nr:hypothetical protein JAAARDRAFT_61854 [Jaapia argillacea MUCL 33604]